jgi:hypothetical protein
MKTIRDRDTDIINDVDEILKAVSKIEGETNNLRGHFFELIVSFIVAKKYSGTIYLNKKIVNDDKRAELDILIVTSSEIIIYECKGKKPQQLITTDEIKKWKGKIAVIYEYFKNDADNANKHIVFNFWTTSDFLPDAVEVIKEIKVRRYKVGIKNGKEIFDFAKGLNLEQICGLLKQYFPYQRFLHK